MKRTERLSHIISNHIFIFATSLAMLVHSTWTFGTLFSGKQPVIDGTLENWISYFLWVTPALLVALAIDVGQIQTSVKLSNATARGQKVTLGITFITLAMAGYYLQWFHLAHHIPALEFGTGLTPDMRTNLEGLKALAIFFVPALLPLSTVLYTLSSDAPNPTEETIQAIPQIDIRFPVLEPAVWSDDTQHVHVLMDEIDTEPYPAVDSKPALIENSKSVVTTRVVTANDATKIHCENCGKVIDNPRHNQKFCNPSCRQDSYRKRQKEARQ